jgi:hypothetical protein
MVWTLGSHSLFGNLATPAQSLDFQRAAQQRELSQAGCRFEQLVHRGHLNVIDAPAADAKDVMMRLYVTVIARKVVQ